jgi:hypothetical protein
MLIPKQWMPTGASSFKCLSAPGKVNVLFVLQ